jgi:hypothetical protein
MKKLKKGSMWRYPTWWWGHYITWTGTRFLDERGVEFPKDQFAEKEFEPYIEEKHGSHKAGQFNKD